jgi:uncharacterized protein YqgC (DUF456 family)
MELALTIAAYAGLFLFFLIMALAILSLVLGLPGTWVIVAEAIIFALVTRFDKGISWPDLIILAALAGLGELFEFLITAYGAKKFGASNKAVIAALLAGLVGAFLLNAAVPILGALLGAFLGVFLGASLYTYFQDRDRGRAFRAGLGAFMGRMGAVLVKGTLAVAMAAVIIQQIIAAR